ncbi:response regulator [Flavobacterium celericrescens]|uniref:histidine kinase n=1 Tax=Flavobacterium celericrescens TaxID=2709780 RepID=A0ABX0I9S0_9FLAO|nr:response regulator [Flavobacterium celericrescens]NHM03918.1 response regulator [Flavobacterium celericrescens]
MKFIFPKNADSTYTKVISLLSLMSFGLLVLVGSLYYYMKVQERDIYDSSNKIYKNEINSLIKLNSENYTSLAVEITYWDEFVDFVKTKDVKWFNTSVANILDNYKVEYVCVYDTKGTFLTKVSTPKIKTVQFIPHEAITKLLAKKVDKFYIKIPEGVVEVYGATIHPSDDPYKNKTKPSGCFFMARLLDNEYFANFEKISTSNIDFFKYPEENSKAVYFVKPLKDYKNQTIQQLIYKRAYNIDFWITKFILIVITIALILSWIVYYYYANRWSKLPLSFIKKILKNGDKNAIQSLKNIRGEFRYIGKLFEENQTKTKELEIAKNKAEESDKLKSAFLMNLSHEIRTPMNAVLGFSELLSNPKLSEKDRNEYINVIQQSGKNLLEIIDDLVEMSKIDSQLIKPNLQPFDLDEFIQQIFLSYEKLYSNEKVEFKLTKPKKTIQKQIISDKVKLGEVITNLLNNSYKFTEEGFVILDYEVDEKSSKINFSVKDSGIGIPKAFQENIFKRFSKINAKGISANEGLGLGLAISKAYVDMIGGQINFTSQEGIGSTFFVSIPLSYAPEENNKKEIVSKIKTAISLGKEEVILVAEDDNINFLLIENILKSYNFRIIRAKDGLEAIEFCKKNQEIDLVLMDIKMPNLDGYEAFIEIRKFNPTIPIIAQTSYSFEEELEKIKKLGFNDFISKPIQKQKLFELIKVYMNR